MPHFTLPLSGVYDPLDLLAPAPSSELIKSKLLSLISGEYRSLNFSQKQGAGNSIYKVYGIRLSLVERLLFTFIEKEGELYVVLLEHLDKHQYDKSQYLKAQRRESFLGKTDFSKQVIVDLSSISPKSVAGAAAAVEALPEEMTETPLVTCFTDYRSQVIELTDKQFELSKTLSLSLPALLIGGPGSGKTLISSLLFQQFQAAPLEGAHGAAALAPNKLLYVCQSSRLAEQFRKDFQNDAGNFDEVIEIKSYEELYLSTLDPMDPMAPKDHKTLAYPKDFLAWCKSKTIDLPLSHGSLYNELQLISGNDTYIKSGVLQSRCESIEDRTAVHKLYDEYQHYLSDTRRIDLKLSPLPAALENIYAKVIIDESQDCSRAQLQSIEKLVINKKVLLCRDRNQSLEGLSSDLGYVKSLFEFSDEKIHVLESGHRSPVSHEALIDKLLILKREVLGGISEKHEQVTLKKDLLETALEENQGSVSYLNTLPDALIKDILEQNIVVIVPNALMAEALRKELSTYCFKTAQKSAGAAESVDLPVSYDVNTAIILTPDEAKGLEFENVVCYNPFEGGNFEATHTLMKNQLSHKSGASYHVGSEKKHRPSDKTALFKNEEELLGYHGTVVAFSRARKLLAIVENLPSGGHKQLSEYVMQGYTKTDQLLNQVKPVAPETRLAMITEIASALIDQGKKSEAKALYLTAGSEEAFNALLPENTPTLPTPLRPSSSDYACEGDSGGGGGGGGGMAYPQFPLAIFKKKEQPKKAKQTQQNQQNQSVTLPVGHEKENHSPMVEFQQIIMNALQTGNKTHLDALKDFKLDRLDKKCKFLLPYLQQSIVILKTELKTTSKNTKKKKDSPPPSMLSVVQALYWGPLSAPFKTCMDKAPEQTQKTWVKLKEISISVKLDDLEPLSILELLLEGIKSKKLTFEFIQKKLYAVDKKTLTLLVRFIENETHLEKLWYSECFPDFFIALKEFRPDIEKLMTVERLLFRKDHSSNSIFYTLSKNSISGQFILDSLKEVIIEKLKSTQLATLLAEEGKTEKYITPFMLLLQADGGLSILQSILLTHPRALAALSLESICTPLLNEYCTDSGLSLLMYLCHDEENRRVLKLLLKENKNLRNNLSIDHLLYPLSNNHPFHPKKYPLYLLACTPDGKDILYYLLENNDRLANSISPEILSTPLKDTGRNEILYTLLILFCMDQKGLAILDLLLSKNTQLTKTLSPKPFFTPLIDPIKKITGNTPLQVLKKTFEGQEIIKKIMAVNPQFNKQILSTELGAFKDDLTKIKERREKGKLSVASLPRPDFFQPKPVPNEDKGQAAEEHTAPSGPRK